MTKMIDRPLYIEINLHVDREDQVDKYKSEVDKIRKDFTGMQWTQETQMRLQHEVLWLQDFINVNEDDPFHNIRVEIEGEAAYNKTRWYLDDLLIYINIIVLTDTRKKKLIPV